MPEYPTQQPQQPLFLSEAAPARYRVGVDPIRGYPELKWAGKRPFQATQYYPAQLKESHGPEVDGWRNAIYWGDNLQVMSHLLKRYRGKVDLVYIDPPFDSKVDYKKRISVRGYTASSDSLAFEEKQYTDIWTGDEYLQFMYERLILLRELVSETGSIWVHCDWRKVAHIRLLLDEVLGPQQFRGHITWRSMAPSGFKGKTSLGKSHDDLLYYSKSATEFTYNPIMVPYSPEYVAERFSKRDEAGRLFKDEKIGTATTSETIARLEAEGRIYVTQTGGKRIKHYLDEAQGYPVDDIWTDIHGENSQAKEQTGYPTQKPAALLERMITMCSNPGDLVLDCFMGSGTTPAVATRLGRRFIGCDINLGAIQTTTRRLLTLGEELRVTPEISSTPDAPSSPGFNVYTVNHYEVFRNPAQARELLLEALEVQPLTRGDLYDGERDGRMVKIMPVNRIATRQDLNELLTNFPVRLFEQRQKDNPGRPVERLLLVCMGHEPDLAAHLKKEVPYELDVEVVDVRRDKVDLQFRRDSDARLAVREGHLVIEAFYPMNLLQKLSLMREDVDEWRDLVDAVMVDFNYDGAILQPSVVDVPEAGARVLGVYPIPADAGTIRVKITDLLSESWEGEVAHG